MQAAIRAACTYTIWRDKSDVDITIRAEEIIVISPFIKSSEIRNLPNNPTSIFGLQYLCGNLSAYNPDRA